LTPFCNPEVFELLGRSEAKLDAGSFHYAVNSTWTPLVEHFFCEEKMLFYELLDKPEIYKVNNLDFLRIFWKTAQLVVMNHSSKKDEIVYPLTLPAIEKLLTENMNSELKILAIL
jgi:hypothetical protein